MSLSLTEAAVASLLTDQLKRVRAERHWAAVIINFLPYCLRRIGCRRLEFATFCKRAPQKKVAGQARDRMTAVERLVPIQGGGR